MALKKFDLAENLPVTIYKRRGSRSIRLSISQSGEVRVSMPLWLTYKAGLHFAETRLDWITSQRVVPDQMVEGQAIGKQYTLHYRVSSKATKPSSRITTDQVIITRPLKLSVTDPEVQTLAEKAAIRTLRKESTRWLPPRLKLLAAQHGFSYKSVSIKQLTSRWGSCDQNKDIALNLFLMQLPWELIDYVLLHELVHTEHLNHSADFWRRLESVRPGAKEYRDRMRKHKPVVLR